MGGMCDNTIQSFRHAVVRTRVCDDFTIRIPFFLSICGYQLEEVSDARFSFTGDPEALRLVHTHTRTPNIAMLSNIICQNDLDVVALFLEESL